MNASCRGLVLIGAALLLAHAAPMAKANVGGAEDTSLLFALNYDSWSTHASFARGPGECAGFANPDLQLRMCPGVRGQGGGLKIANGEFCRYTMAGNFDPRQGTISLWVNPQTWRGSDDRFQIFFTAKDQNYRFIVYKYMSARINFYLEVADAHGVLTRYNAFADTDDQRWQPGRWRKLDAVWNDAGMRLYVDGVTPKFGASELTLQNPLRLPPPSPQGQLFVGSEPTWRSNAAWRADDSSVLDDIRIYNRRLSAIEVRTAYERFYPSDFVSHPASNLVAIPRLATAPLRLDGLLEEAAWRQAARIPLAAAAGMTAIGEVAWASLRHDGATLHLAFESPVAPRAMAATARDGAVEEDDHFALLLSAPDNGASLRFAVNAAGILLAERNGDRTWNSGAEVACACTAEGWSAEVAIPLAALGPAGSANWRGNLLLVRNADGQRHAAGWSPPGEPAGETSGFGTLRLSDDASAVRLETLGDPPGGRLELRATLLAPPPATGQIIRASYEADGGEKVAYPGNLAGKSWEERLSMGRQKLTVVAPSLFHYELGYLVNPPLAVDYDCFPSQGRIDVRCDASTAGDAFARALAAGTVEGEARLLAARDGAVQARATFHPTGLVSRVVLPLDTRLPEGHYTVEVSLTSSTNGAPLRRGELLRLPDLAKSLQPPPARHDVPPPWTPVRQSASNTLAVWGREYDFATGPFPRQVTSAGAEVLREPVELQVNLDGQWETVRWQGGLDGAAHDDVVTRAGTGRIGDDARLALEWQSAFYFDGVVRTRLRLLPPKPLTIRGLQLRYAVDADAARYVLTPLLQPWTSNTLAIAFDPLPSVMKDFSLWLSGPDRGFFWWPESKANWVNPREARPILLQRTGDVVRVTLTLIGTPSTLGMPAEYVMAFMASPARQPPARWRNMHEGSYGKVQNQNLQTTSWGSFADAIGDDDCTDFVSQKPIDLARFTAVVRHYRTNGIAALPYSQPTYFTSHEPEHDAFLREWELYPALSYDGSKGGVKYKVSPGCSNSRFGDYTVRRAAGLLQACPEIGGFYYDLCWAVYCANEQHGCGGRDAFGQPVLKSSAWGMRGALLGIYREAHDRGKIVMNHNHSLFNPLAHNFSDYWYPGEQYESGIVRNPEHFYCEDIALEAYQSELNARIKGVGIIFLPQYLRAVQLNKSLRDKGVYDSAAYTRRTLAPLVLHGIPCSAFWVNLAPIGELWGMAERCDLSAATFTGYWERPLATTSLPAVRVSAYTWPSGKPYRALLAIANMGREAATFDIRLDRAALGLPADGELVAEDALAVARQWRITERLSGLALPGNDYLLLGIRGGGD